MDYTPEEKQKMVIAFDEAEGLLDRRSKAQRAANGELRPDDIVRGNRAYRRKMAKQLNKEAKKGLRRRGR